MLLLASLWFAVSSPASEAPSRIVNQASGQFHNRTGVREQIHSQPVTVLLQRGEAIALTPDHQLTFPPGATVSLAHRLENPGSFTSTYRLDFANLPGDDHDLASLTLTLDADANGIADAGERRLANGDKLTLPPGEAVALVLTGVIPANAPAGTRARLQLTATIATQAARQPAALSTAQTISATNTDTLTVGDGIASLKLTKSASRLAAQPGDEVTFTLTGSNTGNAPATGVPVTVDGVPASLVLVRDAIPRNTVFSAIAGAGSARVLFHHWGEPDTAFRTQPPADLALLDAVAFAWPELMVKQSFKVAFTVRVGANASGDFRNTAHAHFSAGGSANEELSNPVVISVPTAGARIANHLSNRFAQAAPVVSLGSPLFLRASAAGCNTRSGEVERRRVFITSTLTGDREVFWAEETGPNTGLFHVLPGVETRDAAAQPGDGVMQTCKNDRLLVEFDCGDHTVSTTVLIDPFGIVFNSRDNTPVAGAVVTLIDVTGAGNGGQPGRGATVFFADGATPAPSTVTTGADGRFDFPLVPPSSYRLEVAPPAGLKFPSAVAPGALSASRTLNASGSFGGNFPVDATTGAVNLDVPVDPAPVGTGLFVEKTASRTAAELGDLVGFSIRVRNTTSTLLTGLRVADDLPAGFRYVPGSARLDRLPLADPAGGVGPRLDFDLGALAGQATVTLTYQVRVGVGALQGDGINRARASTMAPAGASNLATCRVRVEPGVFTDQGVVLGKVFVDANTNRVQDAGEPGVPGVRLYLEDGTFVITDGEGKFSLYGLRPRTHVLKVDNTTLPPGAKLLVLSTDNAGDAGSRFVNLKKGELHRANFAIASTPEALANVTARRAKGDVRVAEIEKGLAERLSPDGEHATTGDVKSRPANGLLGSTGDSPVPVGDLADRNDKKQSSQQGSMNYDGRATSAARRVAGQDGRVARATPESETGAPNYTNLLPPNTLNGDNSRLPSSPVASAPRVNLEQSLTNLTDNALGFLDLKDGDTLPMAQANVRVKGVLGATFVLRVNGQAVPDSRIGRRATLEAKRLQAWEFIGVSFQPGTNALELLQQDSFGNARGSVSITVRAPNKLGRTQILLPKSEQPADGVTPARITVRLTDADGVPVTSRTPLTLEASHGRWQTEDLDPREPATQVFIEGGRGEYLLLPPAEPVTAEIRVSSGVLGARAELPFLPDLRPLLAVGVVEGAINLRSLSISSLVPARSRDGFEEELRSFATSSADGKVQGGGRVAFFIKGKIKGDYLLTAGYDSDKDTRERLFRDIRPDEFYPVYGDASVRGFDAQSTGRLYVRVDKRKSYLLYGDFNTASPALEGRGLANYSRSLTGIKEHFENRRVRANVWASEDSTRQVVEEIAGNGTSGPYRFRTGNALVNSERVEVLTRDPNHPDIILRAQAMARFTDYTFEPFTGELLFKAPVPSLDASLNPISIRVTYETEQGGDRFWVYGGDAQLKLTERVEVGGSAVRDENPLNHYQLYSANMTLKLAPQTFLFGEVARSESELGGIGDAGRVELRHKSAGTELRAYFGETAGTFTNAGSIQLPGRIEGGLKLSLRLDEKTRVTVQGVLTDETQTGSTRRGVGVDVERTLPGNVRVEVGGRVSEETTATGTGGGARNDVRSAKVKATAPVPKLPGASVNAEYENDLVATERRTVAVGTDYQLRNKTRLYAKHEFVSDLAGPLEANAFGQRNTTVVGLDTEYMRDGQLFNEYRARDSVSGREAEGAIGLRNLWHVADGLRLNTTFERVMAMQGDGRNESTAGTAAIEYTRDPDWKGTARLELRDGANSDSLLNTLGYARKLDRDWTFLGKTILYLVDNSAPGSHDRVQGRLQTGLAWRQTDVDRWSALMKYEFKYEDGDVFDATSSLRRQVHILSLHANHKPSAEWTLSGHYAGKLSLDTAPQRSTYHAHLLSGRALYELTSRWDVALNVSTLFSERMASAQFGVGPEIGVTLRRNLRLGIGYNFLGFRERDLSEQAYTSHGVFIALRLKFDEGLFALGRKQEEAK
ncbi:MAG: hypothetical protein FD161_3553 [Limisphaerales bacterium]|nr:MAG: hypothetical protein FD161_3553 [Limisphaerales bacterium]KAG0507608.1 MAG: hypothetical protein E1N63_3219 [Limisphaerales bacterium]TXT48215.1 MAG: hypothetical protein FD140_3727 [Limisphaerales bacterium]